ncbi:hypothetical protein E2C01_060109 [Portunus trituberculatus]|uniref:Uncharacterized protein n=1 Tax=Portunus trituberculatus TaxID=210409 RepID=A0A5B7HAH3_PORTR|nr:hypothetical protein [Portunus trituberculatus]
MKEHNQSPSNTQVWTLTDDNRSLARFWGYCVPRCDVNLSRRLVYLVTQCYCLSRSSSYFLFAYHAGFVIPVRVLRVSFIVVELYKAVFCVLMARFSRHIQNDGTVTADAARM